MNILHIMPHMGHGPGKAVSTLAILSSRVSPWNKHEVMLLEPYENRTYIDICRDNMVWADYLEDSSVAFSKLSEADIIQLEWWHHPKMLGWLLSELSGIPARIIVWCHISGCTYPYVTPKFVEAVNSFIFSTQYSLENALWSEKEREYILNNTATIPGSGSLCNKSPIQIPNNDSFVMGYMGTLDYIKLSPEFVKYCAAIKIPNVKIVMAGYDKNKENILNEAREYGIEDRFVFTGFVNNVEEVLSSFDIFIYLLNREHYGTTDNVLLEAMSAGKPIIAFNQCGEKYVIENGKTGILINNINEFSDAVNYLYTHPDERTRLGCCAKDGFNDSFAAENTLSSMNLIYEKLIKEPKKHYKFGDVFGEEPYQWFLSGLGVYGSFMESGNPDNLPEILKSESKSSISHFHKYYPNDERLSQYMHMVNRSPR